MGFGGRLIVMIVSILIGAGIAHGDGQKPSGGLLLNAFAEHFARHLCITRFPELRHMIESVYAASRLRFITVGCQGLQCTDAAGTRDLNRLWADAQMVPEQELRAQCTQYAVNLQNTEGQYADELRRLFPNP